MKARFTKSVVVALGAAALAAPGAGASLANGDGGASGGSQVSLGGGNGASGGSQVSLGGGNGASGQVAEGSGGGAQATRAQERDGGFAWFPLVVASCALAGLGAAASALRHGERRPRQATLTL